MKVLRIYGTYYGERKLAWTGFEDRFLDYFRISPKGIVRRWEDIDWVGWDRTYTIG